MDILTDYRITASRPSERSLSIAAERVRVAQERLLTSDEAAELEGLPARVGWLSRLVRRASARPAAASSTAFGRTGSMPCVPCTPATR